MPENNHRQPHAVLSLKTRQYKAEKIARLLELESLRPGLSILEIGTGSGGIAHYLAGLDRDYHVYAVDTVDNRRVTDGFVFKQVDSTTLPFSNNAFDIVITNHVIEHVGEYPQQISHLEEIHRVLKANGTAYLAVPNRWMLVEPHYQLVFLSYWPRKLRTPYLRLMRKGSFYDCEPLTQKEVENMLQKTGFSYRNICAEALKLTLLIEKPDSFITDTIKRIPDSLILLFSPIIPTLIYRMEKDQ